MLFTSASVLSLIPALLPLAYALPTGDAEVNSLERRATTLGTGSSYQQGSISSTFRWQASGILTLGGCNAKYGIKNCYMMYEYPTGNYESTLARRSLYDDDDLVSYFNAFPEQNPLLDPTNLPETDVASGEKDGGVSELLKRQVATCVPATGGGGGESTPSQRQRIELYSWPGAAAGQTWSYSWKSYLVSGTSTSVHFFHLWQLLRRDSCGGPVITLDAKAGLAVIGDTVRGCTNCQSVPIASWEGKTIQHSVTVKYGLFGTFVYSAVDIAKPNIPILRYSATGDMGASGSIKFGLYRQVVPGMTDARAFVGDYTAKRL